MKRLLRRRSITSKRLTNLSVFAESRGRKQEDEHKCSMPDTRRIIGDDESSYSKLTEAFRDRTIASYARVILLNPLSTLLPRAVVLLLPTCNRFTANDVKDQWESIHRYYVEKLESVIGPLIGHASDGDSRSRSLMLINRNHSLLTDRRQPIPFDEGFTLSAKKEPSDPGRYVIRNIGHQDAIHQHRKFINPIDHLTRIMMIGPRYMIRMNHLQMVAGRFPTIRHLITKNLITRKDRQNWKEFQEISFLGLQDCLKEIIACNPPPPPPHPNPR